MFGNPHRAGCAMGSMPGTQHPASGEGEFRGKNAQTGENRQPARSGQNQQGYTDQHHSQPDDADENTFENSNSHSS